MSCRPWSLITYFKKNWPFWKYLVSLGKMNSYLPFLIKCIYSYFLCILAIPRKIYVNYWKNKLKDELGASYVINVRLRLLAVWLHCESWCDSNFSLKVLYVLPLTCDFVEDDHGFNFPRDGLGLPVSSALVLRTEGDCWLFDCGVGTQTQLMKSQLRAC